MFIVIIIIITIIIIIIISSSSSSCCYMIIIIMCMIISVINSIVIHIYIVIISGRGADGAGREAHTFIFTKVPGLTFFPQPDKINYLCSGPLSVDPICP